MFLFTFVFPIFMILFCLQLPDDDKSWDHDFSGQSVALRVMDVTNLSSLGTSVRKPYGHLILCSVLLILMKTLHGVTSVYFLGHALRTGAGGLGRPSHQRRAGDVFPSTQHRQHFRQDNPRSGCALG